MEVQAQMPSREYYRRQAQILRKMAEATDEKAVAARYIKRAYEYQVLADAISPDQQSEKRPVRQREQQHERRAISNGRRA
jgi:hypothetical protein